MSATLKPLLWPSMWAHRPKQQDLPASIASSASVRLRTPRSRRCERQGVHQTLQLVPRENPPAAEGALGVGLQETGLKRVPWWQAPWHGVVRTGEMTAAIVSQFWLLAVNLVNGVPAGDAVTGPIGIAILTNEVTKLGVAYVLEFAALISLNLALINVFPFPALDGGRIFFVVLEAVLGYRLSPRLERSAHAAGFAVLIALMLLVTLKDVVRFF